MLGLCNPYSLPVKTVVQLPSARPRQPRRTMTEGKAKKRSHKKDVFSRVVKAKVAKQIRKVRRAAKRSHKKEVFLRVMRIIGWWAEQRVLRRAREMDVQHYCGYGYDSQSTDSFAELDMVCHKLGFSSQLGVGGQSVTWP